MDFKKIQEAYISLHKPTFLADVEKQSLVKRHKKPKRGLKPHISSRCGKRESFAR